MLSDGITRLEELATYDLLCVGLQRSCEDVSEVFSPPSVIKAAENLGMRPGPTYV